MVDTTSDIYAKNYTIHLLNNFYLLDQIYSLRQIQCSTEHICENKSLKNFSNFEYLITICQFCNKNDCCEGHLKYCDKFKIVKKKVTPHSYIVYKISDIRKTEINGYCASGVFLVNEFNEFLAINEMRNDQCKYNLIGGKREIYDASSLDTALREFYEETNNCISLNNNKYPNVNIKCIMWESQSKYIVYYINIQKKCINMNDNLKWFIASKNYSKIQFHPFANTMLDMIFKKYKQ